MKKSGKNQLTEHDVKIEVVDDHVDTVTATSNYLEGIGFKTVWAYNGEDAISVCKKEKPSLLLLDIKMPGMSGFDVAKNLPETEILFATAYDDMEEKTHKFKNSIGLIRKPIDFENLVKVIRQKFKIKDPEFP